jgi:ATP-dependent Clp protease adaptor protein ClpS
MSSDSNDRPDTRTDIQPDVSTQSQTMRPWSVVVWDDPVNLMNYVVYVFQKLFGFNDSVANTKMLEVHNDGRSVVASVERERAEFYVTRLHAYGLQATLESGKE